MDMFGLRRFSRQAAEQLAQSCLPGHHASHLMGTWAEGSFESDQALDWLEELYKNPHEEFLRATLQVVVAKPKKERSTREEVNAVAAADIVACWLGHAPPEPRRSELVPWAQKNLNLAPATVALAGEVVGSIKAESVLQELWAGQSRWLRAMDHLEQRLRQS